jgi:hypothetical protein
MLDSDHPTRGSVQPKSWPVNVVAVFYLFQGLSLSYSAIDYGRMAAQPAFLGALNYMVLEVLYAVFGIALLVSGLGLLLRMRACLTIAVILAGLYLANAGTLIAGATFVLTISPLAFVAALAFVVVGWLQYMILRSKSTSALFSRP